MRKLGKMVLAEVRGGRRTQRRRTRESEEVQREGPEAAELERSRAFVRRETGGTNVACSQFPGNSMNTKYEVGRSVEPPPAAAHAARFAQSSQTRPPYRGFA